MKNLLLALSLAVSSITAAAETREMRKVIICDDTELLVNKLVSDYGELPIWQGFSPIQSTQVVVFANKESGSWTILEYRGREGCVIAVGESGELVLPKGKSI